MNTDRPVIAFDHPENWLSVDTSARDAATVRLSLTGELDELTEKHVTRAVSAVLTDSVPEAVELDASGLTFLGSSGIRCLLWCLDRVEEAEGRLTVTDPAPNVYLVLEITGLLDVFGVPQRSVAPEEAPAAWWRPFGC